MTSSALLKIARTLSHEAADLPLTTPTHVYNPLAYAWTGYEQFVRRYGATPGRVLLVGMNPGPWGMTQTGVPFGDVQMVRDWFGIQSALTGELPPQHPKYPILGMRCTRREGSGSRVWRWAQQRLGTPANFFARFYVCNYCPLLFIRDGHNLIPERLSRSETAALEAVCDRSLAAVIRTLKPSAVVGIGRYAQRRAAAVLGDDAEVGYLIHPSPANPLANRDWPALAEQALGPWLPPWDGSASD